MTNLILPTDFSTARILVTNDDGIHAPGLASLEKVARSLSDDVWVVAPEHEQSGVAHSLTLHLPLRARQIEERRFAVMGTPTDCVLLGTRELIPRDRKVSLVLSGVNRGANVAEDVTYSGTVAATMEAALLEIPAIAFSQHFDERKAAPWETAEYYVPKVLERLRGLTIPNGHFLSVNIPNVAPGEAAGFRAAPLGQRRIPEKLVRREDPRGRPYYWISGGEFDTLEDFLVGSDHAMLKAKHVTITPLQLDLTNHALLPELARRFDS